MDAKLRSRALVLAVVASSIGAPVHAQPSSDAVAAAEQLFEQARGEMDKGNVVAACALFEASRKLDPQRGTLLNLAACFEKSNLLASAWGRFKELEVLSTKAGDEARAQIARERIAALEPRLPKLSIKAPAGLAVTRDGVAVEASLFGTAIFVDPGDHVIEARAPGHRPFTTKIALREAEVQEVAIPALEKLPEAPKPVEPVSIVVRDDDPGKGRRVAGLVLAGGGVLSLATGIGFGVSARSTYRSAFDDGLCFEDTKQCYGEGQARTDLARERATVSNVFAGIGVALAATGAVLYFTAPRKASVGVAVVPASGGGAVSIGGRW